MAELTKVGQVFVTQQPRDAIHMAVASVNGKVKFYPGQHIGLDEYGWASADEKVKKLGIVDPFLTHAVEPGSFFWMFLYPYTITSLHHSWSHPDFDSIPPKPKVQTIQPNEYVKEVEEEEEVDWSCRNCD